MSLLQDALRRAQKGEGGAAPAGGGPFPSAPRAASPGKGSRLRIGAAVAAAVLLGAGAVWFLVHSSRDAARKGAPPVASAPVAAPASQAPGATAPVPGVASIPRSEARTRSASASSSPPPSARVSAPPRAGGDPFAPSAAADPPGRVPASPAAPAGVRESASAGDTTSSPAATLAHFNEGIAAQAKGDWETAARMFREVVTADPSLVEGWNSLGMALLRLGKPGDADAAFARALVLDPDYSAAVVNAGLLRLQDGRADEAAAFFSRGAALSPRDPAPRVNLAIAQARLGRLQEAETTLLSARRAFPSNPDVLYHLGTVYERGGDRRQAAAAYSLFLGVSAGRRPDLERAVRERLAQWGAN